MPDHELFDAALSWARKLAEQAPLAIEQIKTVSANGDVDKGLEAEAKGFATADRLRDELAAMGVAVTDTPGGQRWEVRRS